MKTTAQDFLSLELTAKQLREAESKWAKLDKVYSGPGCDKHGFGFNLDSRFSSFRVEVSLDSWSGYYGNSSCSTFISVCDREEAANALVSWLNKNRAQVLAGMAEIIENRNEAAKAAYITELQSELSRLTPPVA
jgi:hypothetical protein